MHYTVLAIVADIYPGLDMTDFQAARCCALASSHLIYADMPLYYSYESPESTQCQL